MLAAGLGKRLCPPTDARSKPMLPVAGNEEVVMRGILPVLALILVGMLRPLPVAAAPSSEIQVLDQSVESHFPDDLTFHLKARSDEEDIVGASLYVEPGWNAAMRLLTAEPSAPAREVELTAVWNTALETIPPFVEITYHWTVELASGATFDLASVQTEYADTTHDWQRLEGENVVVFWYDRPDAFGQAILEAAQDGYDHVARVTGVTTERAVRVVIYNTQEDFCAFYARGTCQDWIGGVSLPDLGVTAQWGFDLDWFVYNVIPHELAHVFYIGEIFKDTWVRVPTWFNEGIAVYNERHDHSRYMALVLDAAERDELVPLRYMSARTGSVVDDEVDEWYAQVWSLVAYIAETYGEEMLGELILTVADNVPFEEALIQTTGMDMIQFEMEWRAWLGYPVESVPTPIVLPTLPVTQFALPTAPRGQPVATSSPRPPATTTLAPTAPPEESPSGAPCLGLLGLALPLGGLIGRGLARRRR